jgi:hypothetical protein
MTRAPDELECGQVTSRLDRDLSNSDENPEYFFEAHDYLLLTQSGR